MPSRPIAILTILLLLSGVAMAQEPAPSDDTLQALEAQSRAIKAQVLDLEAELSALEQEIRYPAQTRWTVFVTASDSDKAQLSQIELQVSGQVIASHQYSEREQNALRDGGAHRLYIGSLNSGEYPLSVRYATDDGDNVESGSAFVITKSAGPQILELHWQPEASPAQRIRPDSFVDTP